MAKSALLAVADLFQGLQTVMNTEAVAITKVVLKRFSDISSFLMNSAESALVQMITWVSPIRSLAALLGNSDHPNGTVRSRVVMLLVNLLSDSNRVREIVQPVDKGSKSAKEVELLRTRISKLVLDSAAEVRSSSRELVRMTIRDGLVSRKQWEECIQNDLLLKILIQPNISIDITSPMVMEVSRTYLQSSSATSSPTGRSMRLKALILPDKDVHQHRHSNSTSSGNNQQSSLVSGQKARGSFTSNLMQEVSPNIGHLLVYDTHKSKEGIKKL